TDNPYTVIHRITIKGTFRGQGVLGEIVAWAGDESRKRGYSSMRIDTHPDNKSMQRALQKAGYTYCGHILTSIGDMRWGYEKLL
ncbi:MAG: GNAT family N-acetyltransferase, partial [Trichococcus flocculiformis]